MKIDIQYVDYVATWHCTQKTNTQRVYTDNNSFDNECASISKFGFYLDKNTFIPPAAIIRITRIK